MAFDSTAQITLKKPTLEFIVGSWVFSNNAPSAVLTSGLNGYYVSYTLHNAVITSTLPISNGFSTAIRTELPTVSIKATSDIAGRLAYIVSKATLQASGVVPNTYTSSLVTQLADLSARMGTTGSYSVAIRSKLPTLDIKAAFGATFGVETWTFNTVTSAHSRYSNYAFNSFFRLGKDSYGVHSNGSIYKLHGDVDFGTEISETPISAYVTLPATNFEDQENKMCSDGFVYGRTDGELDVNLKIDEQEERTIYTLAFDGRTGMHRRRVKIPKGLLGNTWEYKFKNVDGSNFDINQFEVFVRSVKRVIR